MPEVVTLLHTYSFSWPFQGQVGDVLCKLFAFLVHIPGRILALCLVALACDVTRNLSFKGRREHTRKFSAKLMIYFWTIAAASSSIYIEESRMDRLFETRSIGSAVPEIMDLLYPIMLMVPAICILAILNLVMIAELREEKRK